MRTIHLRIRGKSLLKTATKLKPNFARSNSAHHVTLTMILLHARDNAHGKLVAPAKLAKISRGHTIDDLDVVLALTEPMIPDKAMMPMADPGMVCAHTATLTNIPLNPPGNDLAKLGTFMNVLTPTTNLTKDIINSIVCPGVHARKPRHAKGNASVSLNILMMKSMMRICTHNSTTDTTQIPKFKSMIDEHIAHGHELKRHNCRSGDRGECGLHY